MVKCYGVIGWKANARPPGWKVWENAPLLPGGACALLELTDALCLCRARQKVFEVQSFPFQLSHPFPVAPKRKKMR